MVKQLNNKQLNELTHIKEWCLTIIEFLISHNQATSTSRNMFVDVINDAFQKQNLKGLRYVYNDINEWAKGILQSDLEELNMLLQNKFGEDLNKQMHRDLIKIAKILKKGNVSNEDEYRLLLSRVDEIFEDDNKKDEIENLNKLLADYHNQK